MINIEISKKDAWILHCALIGYVNNLILPTDWDKERLKETNDLHKRILEKAKASVNRGLTAEEVYFD